MGTVKSVLKFSLVFSLALSVLLTLFCYLFTGPIVSMFLTTPTAYDYGLTFARILLCTGFLFGVFYVMTSALQACGAADAKTARPAISVAGQVIS